MATITTDTYLDGGTARTAGETWTVNSGAVFTIRTDTRWHANAPASMTGSLGSQTISEGEIIYDGRNVRWIAYSGGSGNAPAIGTTITGSTSGASGYLLGVYTDLTSAPTAVSSAINATGFLKFREVSGGPFNSSESLSGISASTAGVETAGWIEIVGDSAIAITIPRLGKHTIRGDWFYLDNTNGSVGQTIQIPTNGGGASTYCPGVWIETGVGTGAYEYWPSLQTNTGWARQHLGAAYGETDARQNFVKDIGSGQIQIGEASDLSGTYDNIPAQSGAYATLAHSCTYTWANNVVTVYYSTGHLLKTGAQVGLDFTSGGATAYGGNYTITVINAYYYTVPLTGSGTAGSVTARPGVTVTSTAHTLGVGDTVYCDFTSGTGVDGDYTIYAVTSANVYIIAYPHTTALTGGNVSIYSRYRIVADRHSLVVGNRVYLNFTSGSGVDGIYTIVYPAITSLAGTYTWTGDVVTVTTGTTAHGYRVGDTIYLDFTSGGGTPDENYVIVTVPTTTTFTVALSGSGTAGNVTTYPSFFDVVANNNAADDSGNVTVKQTIGNIPPSGCKVRIPNVFLRECATATRASNMVHATLATRPEWATTSAGAIDFEYVYSSWYFNLGQAYSVRLEHFSTYTTCVVTECATALDIDDGGVSMYGALDTRSFQFTSNFAGGTVSNIKGQRGNVPGSNDHDIEILYCKGQTFTNVTGGIIQFARSTGKAIQVNYSTDITLNNCRVFNSDLNITASFDITVNDIDTVDRYIGYTNLTTAYYGVNVNTKCNNVLVDGTTFGFNGTVPNVHPYSGVFYATGSDNVTFRNAGTFDNPLPCGSWRPNLYAAGYAFATGGNNDTLKVQRVYIDDNMRTAHISTLNSDNNVIFESIFGGMYIMSAMAVYLQVDAGLNSIMKGCKTGATSVSGQSSVYGTHFMDMFMGDTMGRFVLMCNEPTTETSGQFTMVSGTQKFNSAGGLLMGTVGDQAIWEDSCFRLGHTGFQNTTPTMSGGTASRFTIEYSLNTGSGYGAWKTANGTNLSAESVDPAVGFKMKVRITRTSASSTNAITHLRFDTTTSAAGQENNLYNLDLATITMNNVVVGSRYEVYNLSSSTTLATGSASSSTVTLSGQASNGQNLRIRVRKASAAATKYVPFETQAVIASGTASIWVSQIEDTIAGG